MSAAKYGLDNLCAIVDVNGLQIDGRTADVMPSEPLDRKFAAFNWHVITVDGHDFDALRAAFAEARQVKGQPTVLIAKTVKSKGVSFMENDPGWHASKRRWQGSASWPTRSPTNCAHRSRPWSCRHRL